MIKTKLIENPYAGDDNSEPVILDIPFNLYSVSIQDGNKNVTYGGKVKNRTVLAVVAVKVEDKEAIQNWAGFIGDKWADIKDTTVYKQNYTIKVKDIKRVYDKDDKVIEYDGVDKDDPARFALWCED